MTLSTSATLFLPEVTHEIRSRNLAAAHSA
jgi:hypothetical protein